MLKSLLVAASAAAMMLGTAFAAEVQTKEGKCVLKESRGFDDKVLKVQVGKVVKGTCKIYISEFFDKKIINANIDIENTADKPMHCQYYVAFFDKDGNLIGCHGQGTFSKEGLKAGEKTMLGSCLIPLPKGFHEKAVSYKITYYEGEKVIGTE